MKANNIFFAFDKDFEFVLGDFGLSRPITQQNRDIDIIKFLNVIFEMENQFEIFTK